MKNLYNKLLIAAAGSGKTTFIVNEALKQKDSNVLITTYTQANEAEIRKKIVEINKCVPANITIQTWFSMLLQHGVRPYQGVICEKRVNGVCLVNNQSAVKYYMKNGIPVCYKEEEEFEKHYFTNSFNIYSDKLSKFVIRCNQKSQGAVIDRFSRIYSHVFIDEVQDLAGYDLEVIKLLLSSESRLVLVGDPRQVTYLTHNERKHEKYSDGRIVDFIKSECKKEKCDIDEENLNLSYRNNEIICNFSSKLYPDLKTCKSAQKEVTDHDGIFLVRKEDVEKYLEKFKPIQLRDSTKVEVNKNYKAHNFGESKGLTFDRVLIYPTKPLIEWLKDNKSELKPMSRARLYVAITRAKYSVGIICKNDEFEKIKGVKKFII